MSVKAKKLILFFAPAVALAVVLAAGLSFVQSDPVYFSTETTKTPIVTTQSVDPDSSKSVVIEAKADPEDKVNLKAEPSAEADELWGEIDDAISGLNDLVGVNMFLDVRQGEKARLEVILDKKYWDRVSYITRVNLKTDISNLWHLYVKEYRQDETSVVYFINDADDKVIDIFSQAN